MAVGGLLCINFLNCVHKQIQASPLEVMVIVGGQLHMYQSPSELCSQI